jgi:hypothetical protein
VLDNVHVKVVVPVAEGVPLIVLVPAFHERPLAFVITGAPTAVSGGPVKLRVYEKAVLVKAAADV